MDLNHISNALEARSGTRRTVPEFGDNGFVCTPDGTLLAETFDSDPADGFVGTATVNVASVCPCGTVSVAGIERLGCLHQLQRDRSRSPRSPQRSGGQFRLHSRPAVSESGLNVRLVSTKGDTCKPALTRGLFDPDPCRLVSVTWLTSMAVTGNCTVALPAGTVTVAGIVAAAGVLEVERAAVRCMETGVRRCALTAAPSP